MHSYCNQFSAQCRQTATGFLRWPRYYRQSGDNTLVGFVGRIYGGQFNMNPVTDESRFMRKDHQNKSYNISDYSLRSFGTNPLASSLVCANVADCDPMPMKFPNCFWYTILLEIKLVIQRIRTYRTYWTILTQLFKGQWYMYVHAVT